MAEPQSMDHSQSMPPRGSQVDENIKAEEKPYEGEVDADKDRR